MLGNKGGKGDLADKKQAKLEEFGTLSKSKHISAQGSKQSSVPATHAHVSGATQMCPLC